MSDEEIPWHSEARREAVREEYRVRCNRFGPFICEICYDEFRAGHPLAKYCGTKCQVQAYEARHPEKKIVIRIKNLKKRIPATEKILNNMRAELDELERSL